MPERKFKMYQSGNQKGIAKNDRQHQSLKKKKRRTTENTITKEKEAKNDRQHNHQRKRTNNDLQNNTHKTKNRTTFKTGVNSGNPAHRCRDVLYFPIERH